MNNLYLTNRKTVIIYIFRFKWHRVEYEHTTLLMNKLMGSLESLVLVRMGKMSTTVGAVELSSVFMFDSFSLLHENSILTGSLLL